MHCRGSNRACKLLSLSLRPGMQMLALFLTTNLHNLQSDVWHNELDPRLRRLLPQLVRDARCRQVSLCLCACLLCRHAEQQFLQPPPAPPCADSRALHWRLCC